jgi:hypothetical protein
MPAAVPRRTASLDLSTLVLGCPTLSLQKGHSAFVAENACPHLGQIVF